MNQDNGLCKTAVTDNNGFFRMNALAAGSYIVYLENNSWSDLGSRSDLVIQVREARTEKVELRIRPPNSGDEYGWFDGYGHCRCRQLGQYGRIHQLRL